MADSLPQYADYIQPFLIHHSNIRGKIVRLNEAVDTIITRHNYPDAVSSLLAELVVIAAMLSSNLKRKGILTIQLKGEGLIRFMVVDATANGEIRGYAELEDCDATQFETLQSSNLRQLMGNGLLAITLNKGTKNEPYQGIVEITGDSVVEAVQNYFTTSEQNEVLLKISVGKNKIPGRAGKWCAGGIMLQHVPHDGGVRETGSNIMHYEGETPQEQWRRATMLAATVQDVELLDTYLPLQDLLYRLFNEDGVWVYETSEINTNCRCSRTKIVRTLAQFPRAEIEKMLDDDQLSVNCQFCNKTESFSLQDLDVIYRKTDLQ